MSSADNTKFDGLFFVDVNAVKLTSPRMDYHGRRIEKSIRKMGLSAMYLTRLLLADKEW